MKKTVKRIMAAFLSLCVMAGAEAYAAVPLMPDVKEGMEDAAYWYSKSADPRALLSAMEEIEKLNGMILKAEGTEMNDLKALSESVNAVSLAKRLKASAEADSEYYLGWTYKRDGSEADKAFYDTMIENTADPAARENSPVKYAVAVRLSALRCFPSDEAILDDPADPDFDYMNLSTVRVNEPLVLRASSADGKYYAAVANSCTGWVSAADIAICRDREEWLSAWDIPDEKALVVYGDKVYTQASNSSPDTAKRMLTMGTVLELAEPSDPNELITNRAQYYNHTVYLPVRRENGSYEKQPALISVKEKVSEGFLPLCAENIAEVALNCLGNVYGWGGMLESNDCSGFICDVYRCFGLKLARNTTWQKAMPTAKIDLQKLCSEDKLKILKALPLGSALYFNGHTMLYLGCEDEKLYVISSVSNMMRPQEEDARQRIRSVVINTLDVRRANGNTWLKELNTALVPWLGEEHSGELPKGSWYSEGAAYCMEKALLETPDGYLGPAEKVTLPEAYAALYKLYGKAEGENAGSSSEESFITREELAAMIYSFAAEQGLTEDGTPKADLSAYKDAGDISPEALYALRFAVTKGLINGNEEGTLKPKGSLSRAELAVILLRLSKTL